MARCLGFAKNPTRRCSKPGNYHGYCRWHVNQCRGYRLDGGKCVARQKENYAYCSAAHNPGLHYMSPSLFGQENLRAEMLDVVLEYRHERDLYHGTGLRADNLRGHQVDHIFEKQCFAFATVQAGITQIHDQQWVARIIRDDIANHPKNLCLTLTATNASKGKACLGFHDDLLTGHRERGDGATLDTYMGKETENGARLQRATTRAIRKAMGKSVKFSQRKLADQGDTPELERISEALQEMYIDMDLRGRSTA